MHKAVIKDCAQPVIPRLCVACGREAQTALEYEHQSFPIIGPFFAVQKITQQRAPYCLEHSRRFERRFRRLRIYQTVLTLTGFLATAVSVPFYEGPYGQTAAAVTGIGMLLMALAAVSFFVKPFIYDVLMYRSLGKFVIKAKSEAFIQEFMVANGNSADRGAASDTQSPPQEC